MLNRLLTAGASAIAAVVVMLTPAQADDWRAVVAEKLLPVWTAAARAR